MFKYHIPKSRSKKLSQALKLAKQLTGFAEVDDGYEISPTAEEVGGSDFAELLSLSEKWKGAAFYLDGAEVDKEKFMAAAEEKPPAPKPVEKPKAEEKPPAPKPVEKPKAEEKPPAPKPAEKPKTEEKPPAPKPAEKPKTEEKPPEPKPAEKPKAEEKPAESRPAEKPKVEEKKPADEKSGCCCWMPFSLAALVAVVIGHLI